MFESFIMKNSKAKRSKVSHICQKTVSKASRLLETSSVQLDYDHWEELKRGKVKENSFKIKGEKLFSGGHLYRKLLKCNSPNVYMQLWKYVNPSKS